LAFAPDPQAVYTLASEAYYPGLVQPWIDLDPDAVELTSAWRVVIVREL
jgi:hypothetical protein